MQNPTKQLIKICKQFLLYASLLDGMRNVLRGTIYIGVTAESIRE